jgi:glycosyltransferase involved in cell wall biosynthesis
MRVAVVHNLPPGGAWRRLANQVRYLDSSLLEICLETATPITSDPTVVPLKPISPIIPRPLRPPFRYVDQARLESAWRHVAQCIAEADADAVFLNPCRYLQAPPVMRTGLPPTVYFCDEPRRVDAEPEAAADRNPMTRSLYRRLYMRERRLDRLMASSATLVATNSNYSASEIERVYGRRPRVVRMGVARSLLSSRAVEAADKYVLSVGRLIPSKGHEVVIRAAAESRTRPHVRIVTPSLVRQELARLSKLAEEHGVAFEVRVAVTDEELGDLYASAVATVYMARKEPLGLASLEAQARGCPVIVANEGGLPETIREGETGWTAPRQPAAVAALIDRLEDADLRHRMSEAARAHASTWTWEASAADIEQLLAEAVGGRDRVS